MKPFESFWISSNTWRKRHGSPQNRRELFLCVLSDQFTSLISLNLFYCLFHLPIILWSAICLINSMSGFESGASNSALVYLDLWFLGMIPCLLFCIPAHYGMALVMRDWSHEDYVPAYSTFWRGLRENWRQGLLTILITGTLPAAMWFSYRISSYHEHSGALPVFLALASIALLLWLLSLQVLPSLVVTYDLPFRTCLRNALLLTLLRLPYFALIEAISLFAVLLYLLFVLLKPDMIAALLIIPILYYAFIGGSLTALLRASFSHWLFDLYLKPTEND